MSNLKYKNTTIKIFQGDITKLHVDAVVNAANSKLTGGGGVDGSIHATAGPELFKACLALGGCKVGEAKITMGYNLPAKFIIHTVGPQYKGGEGYEASYLEECYKNSLVLAEQHHVKSIAFPAISTGAYGFPVEEACGIALETVQEYLDNNLQTEIKEITFVCFQDFDFAIYKEFAEGVFFA